MPPWFWRRLIAAVTPAVDRPDVLSELHDEFNERVRARGGRDARVWYRRQVLRSLMPLANRRVTMGYAQWGEGPGKRVMKHLKSDLLYLWRRASRRPLIPAIVVLTIAIGVGAVTSVFSVADTLLVRPLPLPEPGRIVRFYSEIRDFGSSGSVNYFDVRDIAAASKTLAAVSTYQSDSATWRGPSGPEPLALAQTGPGFMGLLGLKTTLGRDFDETEYANGSPPVAIATYEFWQRALGGRASALESTLDLDGRLVRLVGVLEPSDFLIPAGVDLWTPFVIAPDSYLNNRGSVSLAALGRVRSEVTVDDARAELATLVSGLQNAYPDTSGQRGLGLRVLAETLGAPVRDTLLLLSAIVLAVLLIAATNVTDLLLSDAGARTREFAIRSSLGGGSRRLAGQVMIESTSLALLGGLGGVCLAPWLIATLVSLYPTTLPRIAEIGLDLRGFGVAAFATALTAVLMAIPLVRATMRSGRVQGLHQGERSTDGRSDRRMTRGLVVIQLALSVVLLSAGALLTRTFLSSASTDVGFNPKGMLVFNVSPASSRYPTPEAMQVFSDRLLDELQRVPGVRTASLTQWLPFAPGMWGDNFERVGTADRAPNLPDANLQFVTPGFPAALGLTVTTGRGFAETDRLGTPFVAMVNETISRRWFDGAPVGRRVVVFGQTREIVGVISDKRHASLTEPARPELYMPWNQTERGGGWVAIRTDGDPLALAPAVKDVLQGIDPTIAATRLSTMDARLAQAMAPERFRATLASTLGGVALCLVIIGLYGVMAHTVARRTREIGVRLALGESPAHVGRKILRGAFGLALVGVALGVGLSVLVAPQLQSFLSADLQASDPLTLVALSAVLILMAGAAAIVPARRASRIDPLTALREF